MVFREALGEPPGQTGPTQILKFTLVNSSVGQNCVKLTIKIVDRAFPLAQRPLAPLPLLLYAVVACGGKSHGLRPRHAADTLTFAACSGTGFQDMEPLALCKVDYYGAEYLILLCEVR